MIAGGHVLKLFCGMQQHGGPVPNGDGFVIEGCSELAQLGSDSTYELGRKWKIRDTNLWGPQAPLPFIRAGVPIARSARRA